MSAVPTSIAASTTTTEDDAVELPVRASTVIDVPQEEVAGAVESDATITVDRLEGPFHDRPGETGGSDPVEVVPVSPICDLGPAGTRASKASIGPPPEGPWILPAGR
ncbi:MAG: hypothetical protein JXA87_07700 [Thermoleophilia bacterium]|nr:hypothetical protein [Thermoleophilia bacterium]